MADRRHAQGVELLSLKDVSVQFGGLLALDQVSMSVCQGQITGLIGPNGAGKSTLFNVISGFVSPSTGEISYQGRDLRQAGAHQRAHAGIARTFQELSLHPSATVRESILAGCHIRVHTSFFGQLLGLPKARQEERKAEERVGRIMELLGLTAVADQMIRHLPYGLAKLAEMGRALAVEPSLLLLDEPAAGLNSAESERLAPLIRHLNEAEGVSILLIEHDVRLVMELCHTIHVLNFGKKIAEGTPEAVSASPEVIAAYLGGGESHA